MILRCGFCQKFEPEWNKFVKQVGERFMIKVSTVDCDADKEACSDITGVPTIKIIKNNVETVYNGDRTAPALLTHVQNI